MYEQQLGENSIQLELAVDMTSREVARLFIDHGDVKVVKCAPYTYWVELESLGVDSKKKIQLLLQHLQRTQKGVVRKTRSFSEALRFPDFSNENQRNADRNTASQNEKKLRKAPQTPEKPNTIRPMTNRATRI